MGLVLAGSFFLFTSDAHAQFGRASSTTVSHASGARGFGAFGSFGSRGVVAGGSATSINHDVTRTTPLGTVNRDVSATMATGGVAAGGARVGPFGGVVGGVRGGFNANSVTRSRTAVR